MNRMLKAAAAAVCAGGGLTGLGCQSALTDKVDPCWPERYAYAARQATIAPFAAHVANGEVIDHTVFNYHFEAGTDKLTPGGLAKLDYLTRRRPAPPSQLYLQTARDVAYDAGVPDKMAAGRQDLDLKRVQAVQKYLAASTAGRSLNFDVQVIDPADTTINAAGPASSVRGYPSRFGSGLQGGSGAGGGGGGPGGAGGGGGPGGGSGGSGSGGSGGGGSGGSGSGGSGSGSGS